MQFCWHALKLLAIDSWQAELKLLAMGHRMVGLLFIEIYVRSSRKKSFDLLEKKFKSTGTEYWKSNSVLLLQSTGTELLLKASTEYQYRITFKEPVPILAKTLDSGLIPDRSNSKTTKIDTAIYKFSA